MFKNLLAIKKAVNGVITYCTSNGLEIVELDNWLKKVTTMRYFLGHALRMLQHCFFLVELPDQTYL